VTMNRSRRQHHILAGLALGAAALIAGCLEDQTTPVSCGAGDHVRWSGADYCVFASPLIIEGFHCPEALPHMFTGEGGHVVCGGDPGLPPGHVDAIVDAWQASQHPFPGDTIGGDVHPGDAGDVHSPDVGPLPESACEAAIATGAGAVVEDAAGAQSCSLGETCPDGAMATCATTGASFCACVFGDVVCVAVPGGACPTTSEGDGAVCEFALGERACAPGLYCDRDLPTGPTTCRALPAPCSEVACWAGADCGDGARCHGGHPASATAGYCAPAPAPGACRDAGDCPPGFSCQGAYSQCTDCGCDAGDELLGGCAPGAAAGPGLAITPYADTAAGEVRGIWGESDPAETLWLPCPSFVIERRDERTGAWSPAGAEPGCVAGSLRPVAPGEVTASAALDLDLGGEAWAWLRLRGTFYRGCSPEGGPAACAEGPLTTTSPRRLLQASP